MPVLDSVELAHRVREIGNRWPAVGLALAVVRAGRLEEVRTHGLADLASRTRITGDTGFRLASITKTFTAVAVMQLVEQGLIDLDAPASSYLRAFRLVPRRPEWPPATLRHLLTHTAGLPQWLHPLRMVSSGWFGESVALDQPVPTLADYYGGSLRLAVRPGTVWTYSDHGFAALGQIVSDVTGELLADYFRDHIFGPLGMANTDLVRSERVQQNLATGYRVGRRGPVPVTDRHWVTAAASSLYSTPTDMAAYAAALVGGGGNGYGTLLRPETLRSMFQAHYQPHPRIAGMGLGCFRSCLGGHLALEHQGVLPGFGSQLFLAPDAGAAVVACTTGSHNSAAWLTGETQRLLGELVGEPSRRIRADVPQHPEVWRDICGWYHPRAQHTDMQAWSMMGAGVEVRSRRGELILRALSPVPALYRGLRLHPDDPADPYVYRIDLTTYGLGCPLVVFGHDAWGRPSVHLEGILLSAYQRGSRHA